VIYRRWLSREALAVAAIAYFYDTGSQPIPDTGSLRGDLIALLTHANDSRLAMAAVMSVQLDSFYRETGTTPADLRERILGERSSAMATILRRAAERAEVTPTQSTPRMIALPFDLFRNEAMMTLKPVPLTTIIEIVDDIFLPVVMSRR
jgi:hypothetical protein